MNNKTLVIYDNTGKVWGLYSGVEELPEKFGGVLVEAPKAIKSVSVNPDTKEIYFEEMIDTEAELLKLREVVAKLEEKLSAIK